MCDVMPVTDGGKWKIGWSSGRPETAIKGCNVWFILFMLSRRRPSLTNNCFCHICSLIRQEGEVSVITDDDSVLKKEQGKGSLIIISCPSFPELFSNFLIATTGKPNSGPKRLMHAKGSLQSSQQRCKDGRTWRGVVKHLAVIRFFGHAVI